jgi:pfkB family carbohydrate kinase
MVEVSLLNAPRITVVGSYATGLTMRVERLPSPGETVLGTGYRVDYGGKGSNQAVGCARLGAQVEKTPSVRWRSGFIAARASTSLM